MPERISQPLIIREADALAGEQVHRAGTSTSAAMAATTVACHCRASSSRRDGIRRGGASIWSPGKRGLCFKPAGRSATVRPEFHFEQIDIPRTDGARQFAWIGCAGRRPVTEAPWGFSARQCRARIAAKVNIAHYRELRKLGLNVMAPEYQRLRRA